MLSGKNVLLAITGSIAAYKSAYLVRDLIKRGAKVKVIITEAALNFVTTVTLSTLSKNPVYKDFLKNTDTGEWNNHVELGSWSDIMIVAPATANTLSNLVSGKGDSFFLATYLSCKAPIFVAPAMDLDMYKNESTQNNIKILKDRKINIIEPRSGELASGLDGKGRMEEPEQITKIINQYFLDKATLKNLKILISAGPTYESIDPVRFIGNHSSGKMGFALAREAEKRGANVELIAFNWSNIAFIAGLPVAEPAPPLAASVLASSAGIDFINLAAFFSNSASSASEDDPPVLLPVDAPVGF